MKKNIFRKTLSIITVSVLIFTFTACQTVPEKEESIIDLIKAQKIDELKAKFSEDSINTRDEDGNSLLHIAVLQNDPETVRFLLSMNANINAIDAMGRTPLLVGLENQCNEAVSVLVYNNADIYIKDYENRSAFEYALKNGLIDYILNVKTINQRAANGNTTLHYAVEFSNVKLVKKILELEKVKNIKNNLGLTALGLAYRKNDSEVATEIASMLIIAGMHPLGGRFKEFETASLRRNYSMRFDGGDTLLHIFARRGYDGFIKFLLGLKVPVSIDLKNISGSTALHESVREGNISTAKILLAKGADPNARDNSGNTALHLVMPLESRQGLFAELLAKGANPALKDNYGEVPLHIAVRMKMGDDIIRQLIQAGTDVNERNKKGKTPLMFAIERNNLDQVDYLIKYGADIHAEDTDGKTAFIESLSRGKEMVEHVITDKTYLKRDSNGATPLHIAIKNKAAADVIYYLVEKKALVNTRDKLGNTPLHLAVFMNAKEAGEILLANNADVFYLNVKGESPLKLAMMLDERREEWVINSHTINAKDGAGNTPLHLVAEWQIVPMILYLLDKGADINAKNANDETPLFSAVKTDCPEAIRTLLGAGGGIEANINARDFLGNSVLHACVRWSAYKSAQLLLSMTAEGFTDLVYAKNLAGKTVLHEAARQGNIKFINMFLNARADINAGDESGRSPLGEAVLSDKPKAVEILLRKGASPVQQDMYGRTPLYEAVEINSLPCIKMLRNAGGNPLGRDAYGDTPFLRSLKHELKSIDAVLGTDKFLADSDGNTPLHIAVGEGVMPNVLENLIKKGYPLDKRNKYGTVAVLLAVQKGEKQNAHALLTAGADPFIINNKGVCAITEIFQNHPDFSPLIAEFAVGRTDVMGDGILHYAAKFADIKLISKLLKLPGINKNARNTSGETAYDVALRWNRNKEAQLLKPEK